MEAMRERMERMKEERSQLTSRGTLQKVDVCHFVTKGS